MSTPDTYSEHDHHIPNTRKPAVEVVVGEYLRVGPTYHRVLGTALGSVFHPVDAFDDYDPDADDFSTDVREVVHVEFTLAGTAARSHPATLVVDCLALGVVPVALPPAEEAVEVLDPDEHLHLNFTNGSIHWFDCHVDEESGRMWFGARVNSAGTITSTCGTVAIDERMRALPRREADAIMLRAVNGCDTPPTKLAVAFGVGRRDMGEIAQFVRHHRLVAGARLSGDVLRTGSGRAVDLTGVRR